MPGVKIIRVGGKISRDSLPPGGQANRGWRAPRGASCPGGKINWDTCTVDLDKDKYLTPAPNLRRTRASHESQYTRYLAYSDALKNSFFPRTIPMWNSLPSFRWSHLRPLRSLRLRFRLLVQRYVF